MLSIRWTLSFCVAVVPLTAAPLTTPLAHTGPPPLIGTRPDPTPSATSPHVRPPSPPPDGPMCVPPTAPPPSLLGTLLLAPATPDEHAFITEALAVCGQIRGSLQRVTDPFEALALLRWEALLGVPPDARGLFIGAWCIETAMRSKPSNGKHFLGDFYEGEARALGSFQLHRNVWSGTCGGAEPAPHDLLWAAGCWWTHIQQALAKARRVTACRERDLLRVAEAAAASPSRYGFRCSSRSRHWRVMDAIHKNLARRARTQRVVR